MVRNGEIISFLCFGVVILFWGSMKYFLCLFFQGSNEGEQKCWKKGGGDWGWVLGMDVFPLCVF